MRTLVLIAAVLVAGCAAPDQYRDEKDAVRGYLNDPGSAEFSDIEPCAKPGAVQGTVNWRGPAGGMVGPTSFIVSGYLVGFLEDRPGIGRFPTDFGELQAKCYSDDVLNSAAEHMRDPADN